MRTALVTLGNITLGRLILVACAAALAACQGDDSSKPPVHLNPNMDLQKRFEMQQENPFFKDGRAMRAPVEGTVAQDELRIDDHLYRGMQLKVPKKRADGTTPTEVEYEEVRTLPPFDQSGKPLVVDHDFLERGQERFRIYCSVCHGLAGDGDGINVIKGFVAPPSFWEPRLIGAPIGHFFDVITNGRGNMQPYAAQIPVRDRWAIAAYLRTLQRRRNATLDQVPAAEAKARGWSQP